MIVNGRYINIHMISEYEVFWLKRGYMLIFILAVVAWIISFTGCSSEITTPDNSHIPLQAQIIWKNGSTIVNPTMVDSIRLTIISSCMENPISKTFAFSAKEGALMIKTGCSFTLYCEGLGAHGEVLYKGDVPNLFADGNLLSVRIAASACTPVPPDSLKALPAGRRIMLVWRDCSNNETGFIIKRSIGNDLKFIVLDTIITNSFVDTFDIRRKIPYNYQVYSYNAVGISTMPDTLLNFSLGSNTLPEFLSISSDMDSIAEVDSLYCDTIRYRDIDFGDSLHLVLDSFPEGFVINDSVITWTPLVNQKGLRFVIRAIICDQDSSRDTLIWAIKVKGTFMIERAPYFITKTYELDKTIKMGELFLDTVKAVDPENDTVLYSKLTGPATATVDSLTGIVSWIADIIGKNSFSVIATDSTGFKDTLSWIVLVN